MNESAAKVLDSYLDTETLPVPHAILITGKWGSGKTYFLQNTYEPERQRRMNFERRHHVPFLFVSLFGARSASDVELRIYKAACPGEAVAGAIAGTVALGVGEFFRVKDTAKGVVDKFGKKAIKRLNDYVFVLDDLERVERDAFGEILGLVNSLVADHSKRVILVADEDRLKEIHSDSQWNEQNEKVVGRRASVDPDFDGVIKSLVRSVVDEPTRKLIIEHSGQLVRIAQNSKSPNLRSFSWAIHNAAKISACLIADKDIPKSHVTRTLMVVFATTLWMRSNGLTLQALSCLPKLQLNLAARSIGRNKDAALEPDMAKAKDFFDAFPELDLDSPPVEYIHIHRFENSGVVNGDELRTWVKSQFGFGVEYQEPSWRRLWHSHERPREETRVALAQFKEELATRRYTELGTILHCAGLAIRLSKNGDNELNGDAGVVQFFKSYIDDVAQNGSLQKLPADPFDISFDSHAGLGFVSRESNEFEDILDYLRTAAKEVFDLEHRSRAEELLREAEGGNPEALLVLLRNDEPQISRRPVLSRIPVERLAIFMTRDIPELHAGTQLLSYRYYHSRKGDPLLEELPWARELYQSVLAKLEQWDEPDRSLAISSFQGRIRHYDQEKPDELRIACDQPGEQDTAG